MQKRDKLNITDHKLVINKLGDGVIDIFCKCGWTMIYKDTIGRWTNQSAIDYYKWHLEETK